MSAPVMMPKLNATFSKTRILPQSWGKITGHPAYSGVIRSLFISRNFACSPLGRIERSPSLTDLDRVRAKFRILAIIGILSEVGCVRLLCDYQTSLLVLYS